MSGPEAEADAAEWIRFASHDLYAARVFLASRHPAPWMACFHAQQAAEKALKGVLAHQAADVPRTHDLGRVRRLLPGTFTLPQTPTELGDLTQWAAASRYPGLGEEPTWDDAEEAVRTAEAVVAAVSAYLAAHGAQT